MARVIATANIEIKADTSQFRSAVNGLGSGLASGFGKLKGAIAALGLGHLAAEAIRFGAEYRIQLDNAKAAVDGLTDSESEANQLMKEMVQFAIQTPFDLPGVQDATVRLLAFGEGFGVTSENVVGYVRTIGNAAAATGKGTDAMNNVITVMGKISGQGRVMTRDLNQLTANFPSLHPWEILSEMTGKSVEELRRLSVLPGGLSGVVDATEFIEQLTLAMEDLPGASANWEELSKQTGKTVDQLKALSPEDLFAVFTKFPTLADAMTRRMFTLGGSIEIFKDTMGVALADGLQPFFATMQSIMLDPAIQSALTTLVETFGALASMLVAELAPVLPNLINAFQRILVALMPAAPAIANLAMMFALALVAAVPLIELLAQLAVVITDFLMTLNPTLLGVISLALLAFWFALGGGGVFALIVAGVVALAAVIAMNWGHIAEAARVYTGMIVEAWQWLYDNIIEPVKNLVMDIVGFFTDLYDTLIGNSIIPDIVNGIVEWFTNLIGWIVDIVTTIVNFIRDHWQLLIAIFLGPLGIILGLVITHWDAIKNFISTTINAILSGIRTVFGIVSSFLSGVWNGIKETASSIWNGIKSAIIDPITSAADTAKEKVQNILDKVRSAWSGIVAFVQGIWNGVKSAITGPIQGAYDFVADKVGAIGRLVQGAIDTVNNIPGAGVAKNVLGWLHAEGGVFSQPHMGIVAERGPEAIVPLSNPMRAMQVMHQAGLDRMMGMMSQQRGFNGPLVSMPGAVIQDATDADLVAQRTLVAMTAAMVA